MARSKPEKPAVLTPKQQLSALSKRFESFGKARDVLEPIVALPTRFVQYDWATRCGGHPLKRSTVVHGPSNEGKALSVDAPILTPSGFVPIGTIQVGDPVIGRDGETYRVEGVYPQGEKQLFEVNLSDGCSIECCEEHLWLTRTQDEVARSKTTRGPRPERTRIPRTVPTDAYAVRSLGDVMRTLGARHEIPMISPVRYAPGGPLPLNPYLLGVLLGDGSFRHSSLQFTKPEPDLLAQVERLIPGGDSVRPIEGGVRIVGGQTQKLIRAMGLDGLFSHEKFIPSAYLRASIDSRIELLQGLVDTDGHVMGLGHSVEFSTSSSRMFIEVVDLARGLGAYVTTDSKPEPKYSYRGESRTGRPAWRARITFNDEGIVPVSSAKHLAKWRGRDHKKRVRRIESIRPSRRAEAVCIRVSAPDSLFVTKDFIVTHNTALVLGLAGSFIEAGGMADYVDAEQTTPIPWVRTLLGKHADSDRFLARLPENYEECVDSTREIHRTFKAARVAGELPPTASLLTIIDSVRKLNPKGFLEKIAKLGAEGDKGSVDGMGGRGAMIKANMNAAWLDELIPLLTSCGTSWLGILRESVKVGATENEKKYGEDYVVQGGNAMIFDAALRLRVQRVGYTKAPGDEKKIIGERHRITIKKTKVGGKEDRATVCYFHTSNGTLSPEGFDRPRDVVELALRFGVLEMKGSRVVWSSRSEKSLYLEQLIAGLHAADDDLAMLESEVRAKFGQHVPEAEVEDDVIPTLEFPSANGGAK